MNNVLGVWIYRSLHNERDVNTSFEDLEFGRATLQISSIDPVRGRIGGPGWQLDVAGELLPGSSPAIRFTGTGTIGGEPWEYEYLGFLQPEWSGGVDQAVTMVGSVIRRLTHSGGSSPAGYSASFYAVKT